MIITKEYNPITKYIASVDLEQSHQNVYEDL